MARIGGTGGAEARVEVFVDSNGTSTVRVGGELDLSNVDDLRRELDRALPALERVDGLVFDVGELEFMDSSAITLLLQLAGQVREVRMVNATAIVRRIVTATGLADVLHLEP
jgi:anti-anti-sigma factor